MLVKTFRIISDNWWVYIFFAAVMLFAAGFVDAGYFKSGSSGLSAFMGLLFARFVHRAALFGIKFGGPNPDGTADRFTGGFFFKGFALILTALILAVPLLIWSTGAKVTASLNPTLGDFLPFAIAALVIYAVVLSLAGSWLPASIYGRNTGLWAALRRGTNHFFSVFIWITPALLLAAIVELGGLAVLYIYGFDVSVVSNSSINPVGAMATFIILLIECLSITLISVVLSHYYLIAEGVGSEEALSGGTLGTSA